MKAIKDMSTEELQHEVMESRDMLEDARCNLEKIEALSEEILEDYGTSKVSLEKAVDHRRGVDDSEEARLSSAICTDYGKISMFIEIIHDYAIKDATKIGF